MRYFNLLLLFVMSVCCTDLHAQQRPADSIYTYKTATPDGTGKYYKGREIAHVMGFEGAARLERNTREQEENTKKQ
ncbi:hypothetical protein [Mucilaginibacter humi]|uniref:hypothetical protein n=1 Tax=Mucilaginibacter humi TaxID=2732510 RepID=UPI001C2ED818|nr:hypothetical protein [Mucilaginibacter humi]